MIPVIEVLPDQFVRATGNPKLLSKDGEVQATLLTVLHRSWSAEDRAKFGVYMAEPITVPDGKRIVGDTWFTMRDGMVREFATLEDIPTPPVLTPEEKVTALAQRFGLTLEELKAVLKS